MQAAVLTLAGLSFSGFRPEKEAPREPIEPIVTYPVRAPDDAFAPARFTRSESAVRARDDQSLPLDDPRFYAEKEKIEHFVFGSTFSPAQRAALEKAEDLRFTQEGQKAWIDATKFEITAALEKVFAAIDRGDPNVRYSLGPWSPPAERETGTYRKSRDDLAGMRFLVQYELNLATSGQPPDNRLVSLIILWKDRDNLIGPSDNFRVRFQVHRTPEVGEGFIGLSYKIERDEKGKVTRMFPDIYALPQKEVKEINNGTRPEGCRYRTIRDIPDPTHCVECHGSSRRSAIDPSFYRTLESFRRDAPAMPGYEPFMADLVAQSKSTVSDEALMRAMIRNDLSSPAKWIPEGIRAANQRYWMEICTAGPGETHSPAAAGTP
jgi:hypothetical protein